LTDEQVETMILASYDHAEEDLDARQLIEARSEAETILVAVEKGIGHAAWQQLTPDELAQIAACVREVTTSAAGNDYRLIRHNIEQLDKATRRFAELMMDSEVMGAMKGQTMSAAGEGMGTAPTAPHAFAKAEFEDEAVAEEQAASSHSKV
jgi:molecular chaperone DnaK/molecular chaperone HscA